MPTGKHPYPPRTERGVTLVELIIVITLIPIITMGIIVGLYTVLESTTRASIKVNLADNSQLTIDTLEYDVRRATSFHKTLPSDFADAYAPLSSWSANGSSDSPDSRVLILSLVATTASGLASERKSIYTNGTYGCSPTNYTYNPPLTYTVLYFITDSTLYRRTLVNQAASTPGYVCGPDVQAQKQSCPGLEKASWPASCQASDEIIASNVSKFSIDYYTTPLSPPMSDAYDPGVSLDTAVDAEVTLALSKTRGSTTIEATQTLHMARVGQ